MIFCSNYFINNLEYQHIGIIGRTWIYSNDFKKLKIILYIDDKNGKRYLIVFNLNNNKTKEGYYVEKY